MSVPRRGGKVKRKRSAVAKRPRQKKSRRVSDNTKPRVSKKKPKPRQKRKVSPARQKRKNSIAAKRGWVTRRLNKLREQAQRNTEAHVAFLRQPQVSSQITEQLIRTNLLRPGMVQSDETQILSRLIVAEQLGNFDVTARELANEFSWDIRDVYTLWHSP